MTGARPGKSTLQRRKELAKIHLLAQQLQMDRDTYEAMLFAQARVESAKDLDQHQRGQVIEHLQALVDRQGGKSNPQRPHNFEAKHRAELTKIEALLADDGKPWSYALGMARRMYRKERMEFCAPHELMGLIAALEKQALKRLSAALEAELGERWADYAGAMAEALFGFNSLSRDITKHTEAMSKVLRWRRGEWAASCAWPATPEVASSCCLGCWRRAGMM